MVVEMVPTWLLAFIAYNSNKVFVYRGKWDEESNEQCKNRASCKKNYDKEITPPPHQESIYTVMF